MTQAGPDPASASHSFIRRSIAKGPKGTSAATKTKAQRFVGQPDTVTTRAELRDAIADGIARWETRILVESIEVTPEPDEAYAVRFTDECDGCCYCLKFCAFDAIERPDGWTKAPHLEEITRRHRAAAG